MARYRMSPYLAEAATHTCSHLRRATAACDSQFRRPARRANSAQAVICQSSSTTSRDRTDVPQGDWAAAEALLIKETFQRQMGCSLSLVSTLKVRLGQTWSVQPRGRYRTGFVLCCGPLCPHSMCVCQPSTLSAKLKKRTPAGDSRF